MSDGEEELPPLGSGRQVKRKPDRVTQAIVVALLFGMAIMGWQELRESETLATGTTAPDALLTRAGGTTFTLASLEGKVVLVDFWATWCPPCKKEMPWLVRLAESYEGKGVVFVALNTSEDAEAAHDFLQEVPGLERFAAFGPDRVAFEHHVVALPTLFVVDRDRKVRAVRIGEVEEAQVRALLDQALAD